MPRGHKPMHRLAAALGLVAALAPSLARAADQNPIDARINELVGPVADAVSGFIFFSIDVNGAELPLIVLWLMIGAVVFTFYMGFINFRGFGQALRITRGLYRDPRHDGEISHFQALSAALSGTVGLGNIAGVAVAIAVGGPGAVFWMIVAGFLGMTTKFVECTLAVKYRRINPDGSVSGGPMYYLREGLAARGKPRLGRALATFFAVMCVGGSVSFFQVNQSFAQFSEVTGFTEGWVYGLVMAALVGIVIVGNIKSIARVTSRLVPAMCGLYLIAGLVIIAVNIAELPHALWLIVSTAFSPEGVGGGILGAMIVGMRRATYSSEAGVGSAPIAHSAVQTNEPVTEGLVSLLEPFIDTVVVSMITALVIIITGAYQSAGMAGMEGIAMTSRAFASVFSWFPAVLMVVVILFAYSTLVTWSYYGVKAWTYLVGETRGAEITYKLLFLCSIVIGAVLSMEKIVDFIDAMLFAMAVPNVLGLYIMMPEVRRDLASYLARVRSGEIKTTAELQPDQGAA